MASLEHLSDNTLSTIFSFLSPTKEHVLSLAVVCRRFNTLVSIPWTSFAFEPSTERLHVVGWPLQSVITKLVPGVFPRLTHVKSLHLRYVTMHYSLEGEEYDLATLQALCGLIEATPDLENLYIQFLHPTGFNNHLRNQEANPSPAIISSFATLAHLISSRPLISLHLVDPALLLAPMVGTFGRSLRSLTLVLNSHAKASRWNSEHVRSVLVALSRSARTELELPLTELHLTSDFELSSSQIFSNLRLPHLAHFTLNLYDSNSSLDFWQSFLTASLPASLQSLSLVHLALPPSCLPLLSAKFHNLTKLDLRLSSDAPIPIPMASYVDLFRVIGHSVEDFHFSDAHIDSLWHTKRCEFWTACALAMPKLRKVQLDMGTYPDETQIFCTYCPNMTRKSISSYRRCD